MSHEVLKTAGQDLAKQMQALLAKEAAEFLEGRKAELIEFTREQIKAIFAKAVFDLQPIPVLGPNATADEIADREELLLKKDQQAQLVMAAQKKNSQLAGQLRTEAVARIVKVTGIVASIGLAVAKAGLGG